MSKLRKELDHREHREIVAKNFGPEETAERTTMENELAIAKRHKMKSDLDDQIQDNATRL